MEIRQLTAGDADWVVRADPLFDDPTDRRAAVRYLADPANVFLLALDGERPIGFLRGTALGQLKTRRRQMFLYEIAVAPSHQRRGVARSLIARLLAYSRARHFEEAFVFTDPANAAAVALYRTTGGVTETPADRMFVYRLKLPRRRRSRRAVARRTGARSVNR